jgi:hypothetical protein
VFLSEEATSQPLQLAHDFSVPYNFHRAPIGEFTAAPLLTKVVLVVSAAPIDPWRQLIDVIIPAWGALFLVGDLEQCSVFLARNQDWLIRNLQKIIPRHSIFAEQRICFRDAIFLQATGAVPIDVSAEAVDNSESAAVAWQLNWASSLAPSALKALVAVYTTAPIQPGRIVVDGNLIGLAGRLGRLYPFFQVTDLSESDDISEVADCVASAQLLIAGDVPACAFALFMGANATLLEIQPDGMECLVVGEQFAEAAGAKYRAWRAAAECECKVTEAHCYLASGERHYPEITDEEIRAVIDVIMGGN